MNVREITIVEPDAMDEIVSWLFEVGYITNDTIVAKRLENEGEPK